MAPTRPLAALIVLVLAGPAFAAERKAKPYRLPPVDLKKQLIWGASATTPDGETLHFGGQDQASEDGVGHTRLVGPDGAEIVTYAKLRERTGLPRQHDVAIHLRDELRRTLARARQAVISGQPAGGAGPADVTVRAATAEALARWVADANALAADASRLGGSRRAAVAAPAFLDAARDVLNLKPALVDAPTADAVRTLSRVLQSLETAAETLDAEPPPRALSPIVYLPKANAFLLFGGDHLDYLTNDTWLFDVAQRRWLRAEPTAAPPPRANHALRVNDDGTVTLSGGYTYASNTDYTGGQYLDLADGEWTFHVEKQEWQFADRPAARPNARTYRTGPFSPDYFLDPPPDRAAFAKFIADLPANTWRKTDPPRKPQMNRDWGTAVIDPDRDLILRFAGGHSAHGGSDVLHFHLASNRWELPFPVEFPLGQLYLNTEYPEGFNFNRRPWVTGHTYQSYAYDPVGQRMLFAGRKAHTYFYDPARADWLPTRAPKPKEMSSSDGYYDLTCCATPKGVYCWTKDGRLFLSDAKTGGWTPVPLSGDALRGSVVDNSTLAHDAKRDRLLFWRKPYGDKVPYDGTIQSLDLATGVVSTLTPAHAAPIPYLCQIRYDRAHDLFLAGCTLPPDAAGVRLTPAYDPAKNRWVSLAITGDDPSGPKGRNVSLGLMYDTRRGLFWAVDAKSDVFVLRLDPASADIQPLRLR